MENDIYKTSRKTNRCKNDTKENLRIMKNNLTIRIQDRVKWNEVAAVEKARIFKQ
jgi:hypothetical protein